MTLENMVDFMRKHGVAEMETLAMVPNEDGTRSECLVRAKLGPEPVDQLVTFNAEQPEAAAPKDPPKTHDDGLTTEQQEELYGSAR